MSTRERFDVIASDPVHPWVRDGASLFTREYFETLRAHLNPGGVVSQWIPLDESNAEAVKSELATFFDVFPQGTVWAHQPHGIGLDLVLIGTLGPTRIDVPALVARFARADHRPIVTSLRDVGFAEPTDLLMTYAGSREGLAVWLRGADINRDRGLRLQYLAVCSEARSNVVVIAWEEPPPHLQPLTGHFFGPVQVPANVPTSTTSATASATSSTSTRASSSPRRGRGSSRSATC